MSTHQIAPYAYTQEEHSIELLEGDLAKALAYWRSLSTNGSVPSWREFDLLKLPVNLIPQTHIFDVVDDGRDFLCRFWGTTHRKDSGKEMAGKLVTSLSPVKEFTATVLREMNTVISTKAPRSTTSYLKKNNDLFKHQKLLRLPLANESGDVVHCLTIADFHPDKEQNTDVEIYSDGVS